MALNVMESVAVKSIDEYLDFTCMKEKVGFDIEEGFEHSDFYNYLNGLSFDSGVRFFRGNLVPIIKDGKDSIKELLSNVEVLTFLSIEDLEEYISSINILEGTQIFIFRESGKYLLYPKTIEKDNECCQGVSERKSKEVAELLKS